MCRVGVPPGPLSSRLSGLELGWSALPAAGSLRRCGVRSVGSVWVVLGSGGVLAGRSSWRSVWSRGGTECRNAGVVSVVAVGAGVSVARFRWRAQLGRATRLGGGAVVAVARWWRWDRAAVVRW